MVNTDIFFEGLEFVAESKNDVQLKALEYLKETGLPGKKSESYKYTPITTVLGKNIAWKEEDSAFENQDISFMDVEGSHVVMINGVYSKAKSVLKEGVNIEVRAVSEGKHDPLSLLNTAFAEQELALSVEGSQGVICMYHIVSKAFVAPRVKVYAKTSQTVSVFEALIAAPSIKTFTNLYIDFEVSPNAVAYYTKTQDFDTSTYVHASTFAHVKKDARFYDNTFSFGGALIRNNLTINLMGENCEGHMNGVFLIDGKSHVDNNTSVDHQMPNSYSNELYKGIMDENATGVFNGKIYVRKDAQKTNAFQSNNNILLSDDATLHTKPQLEIWADDVKCSHGCTSGQLDEDAIFYLRARGIDEKSAKGLLLNAFAGEALAHIPNEAIKAQVEQRISEKLK